MESSGAVKFGAHHSFERVAILVYPSNRTVGIICDGSADKRHKTALGQPEFVLASRPKLGCAEVTKTLSFQPSTISSYFSRLVGFSVEYPF